MKYHTQIIRPAEYIHSECFVEVARAVDDALKELYAYDESGTPIIFGAHLEKNLPEDAIIYNSEQIFSWDYMQTLKKHRVWDYSQNNIGMLAEKGVTAELCPIAYMSSMSCIKAAEEQDIPVLIYGSQNERRMSIYHALKKAGVNVRFAFGVYGEDRDALIARAKIVLNVHYYEEAVFEIFRCSHLMANKKCVVSEFGKDKKLEAPFYDAVCFSSYEYLVDRCVRIIRHKEYTAVGRKGFNKFSKNSMVDSLRGLI